MHSLLLLLLSLTTLTLSYKLTIHNADELIKFSDDVNNGMFYKGATMLLDSDITFTEEHSKKFKPIGKNSTNYFPGTFDGQGHLIKNLQMNSSLKYVGLFGYSLQLTVKNVILEDSCSIENSYESPYDYAYVGGIVGWCSGKYGSCNIVNSINMGSVSFTGNVSYDMYIGGITGYFYVYYYLSTLENCANYGSVSYLGKNRLNSFFGGIVGYSQGVYTTKVTVQNCINYGIILYNEGTLKYASIGGIAGKSQYCEIKNCVNNGNILVDENVHNSINSIGTIVGNSSFYSEISYCYSNKNIKYDNIGFITNPSTISECEKYNEFILENSISIGSYVGNSLIDLLNSFVDFYTLKEFSHWILNIENNEISFNINNEKRFILKNQIIVLPNLANDETDENYFDGWYIDDEYSIFLTNYTIDENVNLYGIFGEITKNYTITFDTRGGSPIDPIIARFNSFVSLPNNSIKQNYIFEFWITESGDKIKPGEKFKMPSHDVTLYAFWIITHISNSNEFIEFSNNVNNGISNYFGTTVFLNSDISFINEQSNRFNSIGSLNYYFYGTFNGQGHTFKNLKMNMTSSSSPKKYGGIFAFSNTLSIKNVIIEKSCSIIMNNNYFNVYNPIYIGSILGFCYGFYGTCSIENSVNMMDIILLNNTLRFDWSNNDFYLGGIAGCLRTYNFEAVLKGCVNYGNIAFFGNVDSTNMFIGGLLGGSFDKLSGMARIVDSINYGNVTFNGTIVNAQLNIGGIVGNPEKSSIENCSNYGVVTSGASVRPVWGILAIMFLAMLI